MGEAFITRRGGGSKPIAAGEGTYSYTYSGSWSNGNTGYISANGTSSMNQMETFKMNTSASGVLDFLGLTLGGNCKVSFAIEKPEFDTIYSVPYKYGNYYIKLTLIGGGTTVAIYMSRTDSNADYNYYPHGAILIGYH